MPRMVKRSVSPNRGNTRHTKSLNVKKVKSELVTSHDCNMRSENPGDSNVTNLPIGHSSKTLSGQMFPGCHESKKENLVNILSNYQRGHFKLSSLNKVAEKGLRRELRWFRVFESYNVMNGKVSAFAWHPSNPLVFASGEQGGGSLILATVLSRNCHLMNSGSRVECIRFMTKSGKQEICTANQDGTVSSYDIEAKIRTSLIESNNQKVSFHAVDINQDGKSVYGGDSEGNLAIHYLDCGKTEHNCRHLKLHKAKIRHVEFSPRDPNLIATASLDKTVKLWDIRKLNGDKNCIESLGHSAGVAAAKFSRTDGCRLLTTDLYSQLRVYKAPVWNLEHKITHPHRHHHITIIRASWHPEVDLFAVGRYPDSKLMEGDVTTPGLDDLRSVDLYSASSGKLCHELTDTSDFITSLAEFNSTGEILATTTGRRFHFWKSAITKTKIP